MGIALSVPGGDGAGVDLDIEGRLGGFPFVEHNIAAKGAEISTHGLDDDVVTERFKIEGGKLPVPEGPGLGVEVDLAKLRKYMVAGSSEV